jgi:hypothetical protein
MGPDDHKRYEVLECEVRKAVLQVREFCERFRAPGWASLSGSVTIDRLSFFGSRPCPYCGKSVTMGHYDVRHEDGRGLRIGFMLFHYIDADHPMTYGDYWGAIDRIRDDDPPMTIEEEADDLVQHWLAHDHYVHDLLSIMAEINTEEAVYLGLLTARGIKPLSRLEYAVEGDVLDVLKELGLTVAPVRRMAQNGDSVQHLVFSKQQDLIDAYLDEFDGTVLTGETPPVVRSEARYFGYPACCAEAYIRGQKWGGGLTQEDQSLLFHLPCPGCKETRLLLPRYRTALADAMRLARELR